MVGHTLSYILSKFGLNQTDGSWDTVIFVSYPQFCWSDHYLTSRNRDIASEPTLQQLITQSAQATADAIAGVLTAGTASIRPAPPMTGTPKMPITPSPSFSVPWRTGSSSTASCWTVRTTSDMSLQPYEPNQWRCMHNGCLLVAKRNRIVTKAKASAFLHWIQQGMTHNVNTHVYLGELENIIARPGEDPQDLILCIKTLMDHCEMINDEHCKHELHCCIIHAYCHEGSLLGKLMAKPFKTPARELADIKVNHFAIQHAREQVFHSTKPVDAICHDRHWVAHTSHNSNGHTPSATSKDCSNCTWQHQLAEQTAPTWFPLHQMQYDGTLGTKMPWWQATPTKECTSTKIAPQLGHSMGSPDAHLGATVTTLGGVAKQMP